NGGAVRTVRRLAVERRCPRRRHRGQGRARLQLCVWRAEGERAAANGHALKGDRRLWRVFVRLEAGGGFGAQPGAHLRVLHRPAARLGGGGAQGAGDHRDRTGPVRPPGGTGAAVLLANGPARAAKPHRAGGGGRGGKGGGVEPGGGAARLSGGRHSPADGAEGHGAADEAVAWRRGLERPGFLGAAIRPPAVPRGTARLRFTFTARHREEDVERLTETLQRLLEKEAEAV